LFSLKIKKEKIPNPNKYLKNNLISIDYIKIFIWKIDKLFFFYCLYFCKNILFKKYLYIYSRYKLKLVKGQLARDNIHLDTSSAPFFPIFLELKIKKENIKKTN
jgi:hypothetical protein